MPLAVLVTPASFDSLVEECDAGGGGLLGPATAMRACCSACTFGMYSSALMSRLHAADAVGETLLNLREFFGLELEGACSDWLMSMPSAYSVFCSSVMGACACAWRLRRIGVADGEGQGAEAVPRGQ